MALALRSPAKARAFHLVTFLVAAGAVHWFLLRPILDLDGADLLADKLLHIVVPFLCLVGWLVFGPRGLITRRDVGAFLLVPVGWLVYTLVRGAVVDWYPYPFIDVGEHGLGLVLLICLGISGMMLALAFGAMVLDRRLAARPQPAERTSGSIR